MGAITASDALGAPINMYKGLRRQAGRQERQRLAGIIERINPHRRSGSAVLVTAPRS
jgi:hypothetical protein